MTIGIDYGMGLSNVDLETGIRFGVIPMNDLMPEAAEDIFQNGTDLDFEAHKEAVKASLVSAIESALDDHGHNRSNDAERMADEIVDSLEWDGYESSGDCQRTLYESDGYKLQVCGDGDIFVLMSEFYTFAPFCSPCAPGAGYLRDGSDDDSLAKTYCLAADWFSEEMPCPYPVFSVKTGERVK